jgi:nitric oxide dioxygenase
LPELGYLLGTSALRHEHLSAAIAEVLGFLHHLHRAASDREVMVLHADRSLARHAHRAELTALVKRLPGATLHRWYGDLGTREAAPGLNAGLIDLAHVDFPAGPDVYLCGPLPFMARVRRGVLERGVPAERIHCEVFGPARDLETA